MIRVILEVIYLVSIIYLSILYFRLFKDVVKLRRELQTPIGFKSEQLQRAIRAHSNFCETVPLILILSFILYFNVSHTRAYNFFLFPPIFDENTNVFNPPFVFNLSNPLEALM